MDLTSFFELVTSFKGFASSIMPFIPFLLLHQLLQVFPQLLQHRPFPASFATFTTSSRGCSASFIELATSSRDSTSFAGPFGPY